MPLPATREKLSIHTTIQSISQLESSDSRLTDLELLPVGFDSGFESEGLTDDPLALRSVGSESGGVTDDPFAFLSVVTGTGSGSSIVEASGISSKSILTTGFSLILGALRSASRRDSRAAVGLRFFLSKISLTSAGAMALSTKASSISGKRSCHSRSRLFLARVRNAGNSHHDILMCLSIRPARRSALSSFSMWLVVKIIMRSLPQHDQSPSVKLRSPESVTLLPWQIHTHIHQLLKVTMPFVLEELHVIGFNISYENAWSMNCKKFDRQCLKRVCNDARRVFFSRGKSFTEMSEQSVW